MNRSIRNPGASIRRRGARVALAAALALSLPLAILSADALAAKMAGVDLADTMDLNGSALVLNGAGLRKKLFIKLYVAGLYTGSGDGEAAAIVAADEPMAITLDMVSELVTREKMIDALKEGFAASTGGDTSAVQDGIDSMLAAMSDPIVDGTRYTLGYEPGVGTRMSRNGEEKAVIPGLPFKQALFGIWLSDKPVQANLKSGMLGN